MRIKKDTKDGDCRCSNTHNPLATDNTHRSDSDGHSIL